MDGNITNDVVSILNTKGLKVRDVAPSNQFKPFSSRTGSILPIVDITFTIEIEKTESKEYAEEIKTFDNICKDKTKNQKKSKKKGQRSYSEDLE